MGEDEAVDGDGTASLGPEGEVVVDCLIQAGLVTDSYTVEQLDNDLMAPPQDATVDVESEEFVDCMAEAGIQIQTGGESGSVGE